MLVLMAVWIGVSQGLTMILVRAGVFWLGFIALKWAQPAVAEMLEPHVGALADSVAMIGGLCVLAVVQQLVAWGYKKLRAAMMLAVPDRVIGLVAGLLLSISVAAVSLILASRSSESVAQAVAQSRSGPLLARLEPLVDRFLTPDRLELGQKRLQDWIDAHKK